MNTLKYSTIEKENTRQMAKWVTATAVKRQIVLTINETELAETELLDGCYVIKSDLPKTAATAQELHNSYCDLEMVERAFRTMKTSHLELRPVYVRKKVSTQGHVFVVMLALLLQRDLEKACLNTRYHIRRSH